MSMIPLVVFIFLLWFILLREKAQKGTPLNKEDRFWVLLGILLCAVSVYFQVLQSYGGIPPSFSDIVFVVEIVLGISAILIIVVVPIRYRERIRQALAKRYYGKLQSKIRNELESVIRAEKLTFPRQAREDIISKLTNTVCTDIVRGSALTDYSGRRVPDRVSADDVLLGGHILSISLPIAETLAKKMTELRNDPRYRKKWKLLF